MTPLYTPRYVSKPFRKFETSADRSTLLFSDYGTYGFATFISCYEGEIGLAWLSHPTEQERKARREHADPSNRWRFKILRPGNAVYMPPGTRHLVFRPPQGNQTLGSAIHVVRYFDVVEWLQYLSLECEYVFADKVAKVDFGRVYRSLVNGARHLVGQAKGRKDFEKFGGRETVEAAWKLVHTIEKKLRQL